MKKILSQKSGEIFSDHFETPIGMMEVSAMNDRVLSVFFVDELKPSKPNNLTDKTKQQLLEYFDHQRTTFSLPYKAIGTDFQKSVWRQLSKIQYGTTCCYADIASDISKPKAVRAVGAANGKNPLTIVVPCHRVIATSGKLSGYAGGVHRKAWLLAHEIHLKDTKFR